MSNQTKFQVPTKKSLDPAAVASFLAGADAQAGQGATPAAATTAPAPVSFDGLDNTRRRPAFSMRFTDLETAQLKHIADTTPHSAHAFCLAAVQKAIAEHFSDTK